jgi:hypothetical protein
MLKKEQEQKAIGEAQEQQDKREAGIGDKGKQKQKD